MFQLGGFAICAWLLAARDRITLMASENTSIGRLAVGAVLVIPFIVTDLIRLVILIAFPIIALWLPSRM